MKRVPAGMYAINKASERALEIAKMNKEYIFEYEREIDADDLDARTADANLEEAIKLLQDARKQISFLVKD